MEQLLCHLFGDYFLQSDWMALNKNKRTLPCLVHCVLYTLPFLFLTSNPYLLSLIFLSHFIIDRFGITKYLIWLKNHIGPNFNYVKFKFCKVTGYYDRFALKDALCYQDTHNNIYEPRPEFITVWLYIISDNTLHLFCNWLILSGAK